MTKGTLSTRDYIYESLLEDILQMTLEPGKSLSEKEVAEVFHVSRTPVREAFLRLEKEGLLEIFPQKGSFVSLIDYSLVEEAQFMREQLELAVMKLACESFPNAELINLETNLKKQEIYVREKDSKELFNLDEEFHYIFFKGCKKERVWDNIQAMNLHFKRVRVLRLVSDYSWENIIKDHMLIYQAVVDKDSERAQDIMHRHLTRVWDDSTDLKLKYPQYFKE
ncbi:GntR family transcriptional regulator [Cytobacillus sp. Hz8]|uniref:GntR family transcriptional regulator n=1 Tax=Cytobacillus sp. Hz8 TaxID=3347168 RepID=UPI0035D7ECFB